MSNNETQILLFEALQVIESTFDCDVSWNCVVHGWFSFSIEKRIKMSNQSLKGDVLCPLSKHEK